MAHRISIAAEDLHKERVNYASVGGYLIKPQNINLRTILRFSYAAWIKMQSLIQGFDVEVAWHGLVRKRDDGYLVDDIIVYPQVVTSATVDTDVGEYGNWLSRLDDETINVMHLQGHSHVNMGVSPSSVDIKCEDDILSQVSDDGFYIFVIWNKKGDMTIRIFDFEDDIVYETEDVEVLVGVYNLEEFLCDASDAVKFTRSFVTGGVDNGSNEEPWLL